MEGPRDDRILLGRLGEEAAVRHLEKRGYEILARGFRSFRGEIDIVARDGESLVFAEVKARRSLAFGFPGDAVTPVKQARIRRIAEGYLLRHGLGDRPCRFDVLSVLIEDGKARVVEHIRDAF